MADGQEVTDFRFFIRSIIRHSDLITKEASFEYLEKEGEKLLLEAMDELEVAFSHQLAKRTDCNHVFLNFVPTVIMNPSKVRVGVALDGKAVSEAKNWEKEEGERDRKLDKWRERERDEDRRGCWIQTEGGLQVDWGGGDKMRLGEKVNLE